MKKMKEIGHAPLSPPSPIHYWFGFIWRHQSSDQELRESKTKVNIMLFEVIN